MNTDFEQIVPWNGAQDTGRDVRLKWQRNFDKVAAGLTELAGKDSELYEWIEQIIAELAKFLRRDRPDQTPYLLKLLGGAHVGEAVDSFLAGKGTVLDPAGRVQTNRLEVRGSLLVMELLINELHAMAGDYSFSDAGHIERVEDLGEDTYRLYIRKDTDADVTSLDVDDVLYSIVNNLRAGGTDYYTSWMRVVAKNAGENTLTVVLYPGAEVPGGTNYPPAAGYNCI